MLCIGNDYTNAAKRVKSAPTHLLYWYKLNTAAVEQSIVPLLFPITLRSPLDSRRAVLLWLF